MRKTTTLGLAGLLIALVAACQPAGEGEAAPASPSNAAVPSAAAATAGNAPPQPVVSAGPGTRFAGIEAEDTIRFTGTEPFWGGTVRGSEMIYSTPENQPGDTIAVRRFAGNNGLGFTGTWNGAPLDMAVTPGACSDGMSDRTYPFTVTLKLGDEQRNGCAWTDREPFSGSEAP